MAALMVSCMLFMMSVNVFAAASYVNAGAQVGTITAATAAQSATFAVTTDADDAQAVTIAWYATADGATTTEAPTGITAAGTVVSAGASTITVNSGDTSVAGSYYFKATIDTVSSAVVTVVTVMEAPIQLTITDPTLTLTKAYDGNDVAAVTPGALIFVTGDDDVTVSATATYNTIEIGINKTIMVVYTLAGSDAGKYIKPVDYIVYTGVITVNKTDLTAAITAEVGAARTSPLAYNLTATDYTTDSWTAYTGVIAAAILVESDPDATQAEVDAATIAVETSGAGLVRAYTLAMGAEKTGGAGHTREITIAGAYAGTLAGKYLVVQFTEGTGINAKVSVVMISPGSTSTTVSYKVAGTKVEAWLTDGMLNLGSEVMGGSVYASTTSN